jgi:pilus assembly protein Flp/PilA
MTRNILARIIKDESGATAIEYGLIVALVSMAAIAGYTQLGGALNTFFSDVGTSLAGATVPTIP